MKVHFLKPLFQLIGKILFTPGDKTIRLVAIDDALIGPLHVAFSTTFTLLGSAVFFGHCFNELGAQPQTLSWIAIVLGTVRLLIIAGLIVFLRRPVGDYFDKKAAVEPAGWCCSRCDGGVPGTRQRGK